MCSGYTGMKHRITQYINSAELYREETNELSHVLFPSQSSELGMNPLYLMIPGVIAASFAFMLPVATPPNAIVFANGYLKVADMVCM